MKRAFQYSILVLLSVGLLFITSDIETYFGSTYNHIISQVIEIESAGEIENSCSLHCSIEHWLTHQTNKTIVQRSFSILRKSYSAPQIMNNFTTNIWQPPKFS